MDEEEEIEPAPLLPEPLALRYRCRGLAKDQGDQRERDHADRAIDHKAPAPGKIVGQPAA